MEVIAAEDRGKCSTCGFLSKRCQNASFPTPRVYEIDDGERRSGYAFMHTVPGWSCIETRPSCFMRVQNMVGTFESVGKDSSKLVEVLREPRGCSQWYEYIPGMSPQEHWQDLRMTELELRRQQFEQKMDKDHKEFIVRLDQKNRNFQIGLAIVLGIFAFAEVFGAVVQVAFPNGWPWLMRLLGSFSDPPNYPPI